MVKKQGEQEGQVDVCFCKAEKGGGGATVLSLQLGRSLCCDKSIETEFIVDNESKTFEAAYLLSSLG